MLRPGMSGLSIIKPGTFGKDKPAQVRPDPIRQRAHRAALNDRSDGLRVPQASCKQSQPLQAPGVQAGDAALDWRQLGWNLPQPLPQRRVQQRAQSGVVLALQSQLRGHAMP